MMYNILCGRRHAFFDLPSMLPHLIQVIYIYIYENYSSTANLIAYIHSAKKKKNSLNIKTSSRQGIIKTISYVN